MEIKQSNSSSKRLIKLIDENGNEASEEQYAKVGTSLRKFLGIDGEKIDSPEKFVGKFEKREFAEIASVDSFIEILLPALEKLHAENNGSKRSKDVIYNMIKTMVLIVKEKIANPILLDNINVNRYLLQRLKTLKNLWSLEVNSEPEKKTKTASAAVIALFCTVLVDARIRKIGEDIQEEFCMRICNEFKLDYTDNVRQNFNKVAYSAYYVRRLKSLILPSIDLQIANKIEEYIKSRNTGR